MIESDEIPEEVINFLDSLSDYAKDFYMRLDSKKFFKNFKRFDEIDDIEKAKALSSLITHALIDVDMGNANVNKVRDDLNLLDMLYYLEMYLKSGNFPKECISEVESIVDEINQLEVLEVD